MAMFANASPLNREAAREAARRLYGLGGALAHLYKAGGAAEPSYSLAGRLYVSTSGWLLLSVPNAIVRGLFDALDEKGVELPPSGPEGRLNAHVSVMTKDEVARIGADRISERGHSYRYQLGPVKACDPKGWDEMARCWFVEVQAPELKALRKSYGLTPLPRGDHEFHITFGVRRKGVHGRNAVSKAAADLGPTPENVLPAAVPAIDRLAAGTLVRHMASPDGSSFLGSMLRAARDGASPRPRGPARPAPILQAAAPRPRHL